VHLLNDSSIPAISLDSLRLPLFTVDASHICPYLNTWIPTYLGVEWAMWGSETQRNSPSQTKKKKKERKKKKSNIPRIRQLGRVVDFPRQHCKTAYIQTGRITVFMYGPN